mgnify:CR=1 FL=1
MQTKILDNFYYNFNPEGKIVSFSLLPSIKQEDILMIVNLTNSTVIYNFASVLEGGTFSNNILTLTLDTTAMSATDKLMVIIIEKEKEQILLQKLVDLGQELNEMLFKIYENYDK